MLNMDLFEKELQGFDLVKPGHFIDWFKQLPDQFSSKITCVACGAKGNVSVFGKPLGLIFVAGCEEIRNNPELSALTH